MKPLSDILCDTSQFARGVELLTTRGTMGEAKATDGRPQEGETQEDAGFRQSAKIMDLFS